MSRLHKVILPPHLELPFLQLSERALESIYTRRCNAQNKTGSEAQAKKDASALLASAEIERAKGVAEANRIIGESLTNNEAYLRYLFVNNLENTKNQVIYVPTEANLPVMEASRFIDRRNNPME